MPDIIDAPERAVRRHEAVTKAVTAEIERSEA